MKGLRIFCITLFSLLACWVHGQSVDSLVAYADKQFAAGQYHLAAKEYQRALFFGPAESVGLLTIKTGDCFFEQKNFSEAEKYYRFASNIIESDTLKFDAIAKRSVCLIHQKLFRQAILELYNASADFSREAARQKDFLLGTSFFGAGDFREAEKHFLLASGEENQIRNDSISLLLSSKKLMKPDPDRAFWMSIIVPGAGQIYAGDVKNGLNSAALYFGFMALLLNMTVSSGWVDAIFTVAPWWQRYYTGGYNNARKIAYAKREANRSLIYQNIYRLIYH